jgi:NAD(P)-dependent dehydrogenase (short-subunit alcohol dehydrogenase family)
MTKTFFLTASGRGLGRSITTQILERGHQLVATARNLRQLDEFVQDYPGQILAVRLDVTDEQGAKDAVAAGIDRFGQIDVLINNAGQASVGSVEDMPQSEFRQQMEINFFGAVNVAKAILPHMRAAGSGRIILISSIGARIATPGASAYYSSKWAVSGFAESLAMEVAPLGIKVTAVEPGGMRTDFAEASSLKVLESNGAYDETVGATVAMMTNAEYGASLGDPAAVAALILKVAELETPPVRILAGETTYNYATSVDRQRTENDSTWKWLSVA